VSAPIFGTNEPTDLERKVAEKCGDDPYAIARRRVLLEANEAVTDKYVKGYEWDAGEDGYHVPTESERILIEDAIAGLLADEDFVRTFNAWQDEVMSFARSETPAGGTAKVPKGMDSAPKDGTPILGFVPSYYQGKGAWVVVLWLGEKGMREAGWMDNRAWLVKPSCWLPLPPSPTGNSREGGGNAV
jgi:hypothetical protein